jgi:hypothetical protein
MAEDILEALAGPFERTGARRDGRVPHYRRTFLLRTPFDDRSEIIQSAADLSKITRSILQ